MNIKNVMELSTHCISVRTADILNDIAYANEAGHTAKHHIGLSVYFGKKPCGWIVDLAGQCDTSLLPDDLASCVLFALDHGCTILYFTRDVEYDTRDGLKYYDWIF